MSEPGRERAEAMRRRIRRRYQAERRFRAYGASAIGIALLALVLLLASVTFRALPAFWQHEVELPVHFAPDVLDPDGRGAAALPDANYGALVKQTLRAHFPDVTGRSEQRALSQLL